MKILNWEQKSWWKRELDLFEAGQPLGTLTFKKWSNYDADYITPGNTISFVCKGFFDQDITILYNGEAVGSASVSSLSGKATLHLLTGELYTMKSDFLSSNRTVHDTTGELILNFIQPGFSYSKGTIEVSETLPELAREVLVSACLYLKSVTEQQVAMMIAVFFPLFTNVIIN